MEFKAPWPNPPPLQKTILAFSLRSFDLSRLAGFGAPTSPGALTQSVF